MQSTWAAVWKQKKQAANRPDKNYATLKTLLGSTGKNKTLLDIGCGKAEGTIRYAKNQRAKIVLLDNCAEALEAAKEAAARHNVKPILVLGDAQRIELPKESADIVHSKGVLEHFPEKNRAQILKEANRILVPGGKIIITVPNALNLPLRVNTIILKSRRKWFYEKGKPMTPIQLAKEMRNAGFVIKKVAGTSAASSWLLGPLFLSEKIRSSVQRKTRRTDLNVVRGLNRFVGKDITILAEKPLQP